MKLSAIFFLVLAAAVPAAESDANGWTHQELRRFPTEEARQGVAVDGEFFYAITNTAIGKYRKDTGAKAGAWKQEEGGPLKHMNAGIVREGKLYCAHSNFPNVPMASSVEIFDVATMQHTGSQSLGIGPGSLTWVDFREGHWYACFANYTKEQAKTGHDNSWTELVRYDAEWRRTGGWIFPPGLVERFAAMSASGGSFGPGGHLFVTGHDAAEMYVLDFPTAGPALLWRATIPISAQGQAFAWDAASPGTLYSIGRKAHEVIVSKVAEAVSAAPAQK